MPLAEIIDRARQRVGKRLDRLGLAHAREMGSRDLLGEAATIPAVHVRTELGSPSTLADAFLTRFKERSPHRFFPGAANRHVDAKAGRWGAASERLIAEA